MADILIRGYEMPSRCFACPKCYVEDAEVNCVTSHGSYLEYRDIDAKIAMQGRPPDCHLIELPPHGRLIDADALMLIIKDYIDEYSDVDTEGYHNLKWCAMKEVEMAIEDAPTVIEESEKT